MECFEIDEAEEERNRSKRSWDRQGLCTFGTFLGVSVELVTWALGLVLRLERTGSSFLQWPHYDNLSFFSVEVFASFGMRAGIQRRRYRLECPESRHDKLSAPRVKEAFGSDLHEGRTSRPPVPGGAWNSFGIASGSEQRSELSMALASWPQIACTRARGWPRG